MVDVLGVELKVGEPFVLGALSVFPLVSAARGSQCYVAGPDAFDQGLARVAELDPPQVPELVVENLATVPLLLVEGETLVGGNQNRTLNTTVLLAPGSRTVIPVSCVEAGRWGSPSDMARSRSHLPVSLRAAKTANLGTDDGPGRWRSNQGLVWEEVERQSARHGVRSATSALEDVQEGARGDLDTALDGIVTLPGQVGIVCAAGDTVLGMDLFDRPATLDSYLRALVAGYQLDADPDAGPALINEIEHFLAGVDQTRAVAGPAVGLGEELRLRGPVSGLGLRVGKEFLHLVAFPVPEPAG